MKKFLKSFLVLASFSTPTTFISSCSNRKFIIINHETDYLSAFKEIFSTKDNKPFLLLPNLNKKNLNNIEILKLENEELKINCEKYQCEVVYHFNGKSITTEIYNQNNHKLFQYAIDEIAKLFSILPFEEKEKADTIYDFEKTHLRLEFNYKNSIYFFNKYKNEKKLIFWSKPNFIIKNDRKEFNNEFLLFFDKDLTLNKEIIKTILEAYSVEIKSVDAKDKKINQLEITFKIDQQKKDLDSEQSLIKKVKNLFFPYQKNLIFENKNNLQVSNNLVVFEMENNLIERIAINFTQGEKK